jgi:hypothetical protein
MTEINKDNFFSFLKRYKNCHPLFILRTLENSKSLGKTFDLLEDFCGKNNLIWIVISDKIFIYINLLL